MWLRRAGWEYEVLIQSSGRPLHLSAGCPYVARVLGLGGPVGVDFCNRYVAIHDHKRITCLPHSLQIATEVVAEISCLYFHLAKLIKFRWLSQG